MGRLLRLTLTACLLVPPISAQPAVGAAPDTLAVRAISGFVRPDPLPSPRWNHGAAVVGGKLYVFGGFDGTRWTNDGFALDPVSGRWSHVASMPASLMSVSAAAAGGTRIVAAGGPPQDGSGWRTVTPARSARMRPSMVRLNDGRIFVTGGFTGEVTSFADSEIYDPVKETWTAAAPMTEARYSMAFALLRDGRVLAAGGRKNLHNSASMNTAYSEVYDPAADRWTPTGPMVWGVDFPLTFVLPDGQVMCVGGGFADGSFVDVTQIFDPKTLQWRQGPRLNDLRKVSGGAILKDGRFLVAGGYSKGGPMTSAEVFDPHTGRWTAVAPMAQGRADFTLTTLPDGRVLAAGGPLLPGEKRIAEIYDPSSDAWKAVPGPQHGHATGTSALIGGRVLLIGGADEAGANRETESFDPASGTWTPGPLLAVGRLQLGTTVLDGGGVLAIGGSSGGYPLPAHAEAEVLFPDRRPARDRTTYTYDAHRDRWSSGPPLTRTRIGLSLAAAGNGLYALGGSGTGGWGTPDFDVLRDDRWRAAGRLPLHFLSAASAVLDGKIYVAGGSSAPRGQPVRRVGDANMFDPATGQWSALPPMPTARLGPAGAALDGKFYVVGGEPALHAPSLETVEAFDPAKGSWDKKAPLPRGVRHAVAAALNGRLYVVGGSPKDNEASGVVQVYDPHTDRWTVSEQTLVTEAPLPPPQHYLPPIATPAPAPVPHFASKGAERPHDFALVVGVGYYKSLPAADFAENDAREMAGALGALGVPEENVVVLTGAKATLSEVSKYVEEWLPRRVSKDSRVYFYFSGHGAPDVKDGSAYLMPWDGDAAFVKSTGFPLTRLYAALSDLPVARVVAMLDSCFSGAGGRSVLVAGARPLVTVQLPKVASPKISVLTASESEEIAGSFPERGHGLFSYYLLQGLNGAAKPEGSEHLTLDDLYGYVHKHVIIDARRQNREQTPTMVSPNPKLRLY
jgi:N-acetylneuraminic acid mutarotase